MHGIAFLARRAWKVLLLLILVPILLILSIKYNGNHGPRAIEVEPAAAILPDLDLTSGLLREVGYSRHHASTYCKGIYVTSWIAGTRRAEELIRMVERTELNSLVIDIKDATGRIAYDSQVPLAREIGACQSRIPDIDTLLARCHRAGIYTIARIVVFQDPHLGKYRLGWALKDETGELWRDHKGLSWMDPACKEVWQYNLDLAKEAARKGFDEIQFDYIRFPSDGRISGCIYPIWNRRIPKHEIIRQFFAYASGELAAHKIPISVDLFGLTLWHDDDLNIGQRIIDAMNYVDFICPMVYPSHYPRQFMGFENPAEHPYEIVYQSLIRGQSTLSRAGARARLRPWLQDFQMGAQYDEEKILLQKKAVYDARCFGWTLWNPANRYTETALESDWMGRILAVGGGEGWMRSLLPWGDATEG